MRTGYVGQHAALVQEHQPLRADPAYVRPSGLCARLHAPVPPRHCPARPHVACRPRLPSSRPCIAAPGAWSRNASAFPPSPPGGLGPVLRSDSWHRPTLRAAPPRRPRTAWAYSRPSCLTGAAPPAAMPCEAQAASPSTAPSTPNWRGCSTSSRHGSRRGAQRRRAAPSSAPPPAAPAACAGVATSAPMPRTSAAARSTSTALPGASTPRDRYRLSSSPTRTCPPQHRHERHGRELVAGDAERRPHRPIRQPGPHRQHRLGRRRGAPVHAHAQLQEGRCGEVPLLYHARAPARHGRGRTPPAPASRRHRGSAGPWFPGGTAR